ncbi:MAG: hypothetical protein NVS4B12_05760 [Ktedonobacteraceae bacterium]
MLTSALFWQRVKTRFATKPAFVLVFVGVLLLGNLLSLQMFRAFAQASCSSGNLAYTVVMGDTLSRIAARYHSSWWFLASHNHIANANLIFPEQTICIPTNTPQLSPVVLISPSHSGYVAIARNDALAVGLAPDLFVRQIAQESGFDPSAFSPAGALGIAQFEPTTAVALGVNPWNPAQALIGAAYLMSQYVKQYNGDYAMALAAYNAGPGTVQRAVQIGGVHWSLYLPTETKNYISIILLQ